MHHVPGASWAWSGVRVGPAHTVKATGGYADRSEAERLAWLRSVERAWLDGLWNSGQGRFEVRYTNDPGSGMVSCALLASTFAPDPDEAVARALAWRDRLGRTPGHVVAAPLAGEDLRERLDPRFHRPVVREIRKRLIWGWAGRPDAPFQIGAAVFPFHDQGRSWEPVWSGMAVAEHRVMLSVCLEPRPARHELLSALETHRREHARLAVATDTGPVYSVRIPPDPLSAMAVPLYEDAFRRFSRTGRIYRVRITVAAEERLPDGLPEQLVAAISPDDPQGQAMALRPAGPEEAAAWLNVARLGQAQLETTYAQGVPPGHLHPAVRELAGTVDVNEAGAVFQLPCETPQRPPLFERVVVPSAPSSPPPPRVEPDSHLPTFMDEHDDA